MPALRLEIRNHELYWNEGPVDVSELPAGFLEPYRDVRFVFAACRYERGNVGLICNAILGDATHLLRPIELVHRLIDEDDLERALWALRHFAHVGNWGLFIDLLTMTGRFDEAARALNESLDGPQYHGIRVNEMSQLWEQLGSDERERIRRKAIERFRLYTLDVDSEVLRVVLIETDPQTWPKPFLSRELERVLRGDDLERAQELVAAARKQFDAPIVDRWIAQAEAIRMRGWKPHRMLLTGMDMVDAAHRPAQVNKGTPIAPKLSVTDQTQIAAWIVEYVEPHAEDTRQFDQKLEEVRAAARAGKASTPPDAVERDGAYAVAQFALAAFRESGAEASQMAAATVRAAVDVLLTHDPSRLKPFFEELDRRILLAEFAALSKNAAGERDDVKQIRLRISEDGKKVAVFLVELTDARVGLMFKAKRRWRWIEGAAGEVLASVPDQHFERAVAELKGTAD